MYTKSDELECADPDCRTTAVFAGADSDELRRKIYSAGWRSARERVAGLALCPAHSGAEAMKE
jgi:hypothetical protein